MPRSSANRPCQSGIQTLKFRAGSAGLVASIAASVLAGVVAVQVFDLPWTPNWALAAVGGSIGVLMTLLAGLWATRKVLDAPPSVTLRELQG